MFPEIWDIAKACAEFAKREGDTDLLKAWKKGFELGYFNLAELSAVEASAVFESIFSVMPTFGVPMLYFTIAQHIFGEFASIAFSKEEIIITDYKYERYIQFNDSTALLFIADEKDYTPELTKLNVIEIITTAKTDFSKLLYLLLAARCVGTAKYAIKIALDFLKEWGRLGYENFNYCH